jgi:hypothetical protein
MIAALGSEWLKLEKSDRAGVVPPFFQAKDNQQYKVPSSHSDPGPVRF